MDSVRAVGIDTYSIASKIIAMMIVPMASLLTAVITAVSVYQAQRWLEQSEYQRHRED